MKVIKVRLEETLNRLGISRYALAAKTGISYQIIDKYYKNKANRYDKFTLARICDALNCDLSDILELCDE